eukprot:scaffold1237_cov243-Pinguiococcus_pyrenoidosus.AAC.49
MTQDAPQTPHGSAVEALPQEHLEAGVQRASLFDSPDSLVILLDNLLDPTRFSRDTPRISGICHLSPVPLSATKALKAPMVLITELFRAAPPGRKRGRNETSRPPVLQAWTEKHRPRNAAELCVSKKRVREIRVSFAFLLQRSLLCAF